ncbi:MAG TPA: hypothetical protein VK474_04735 [Chthoniobacterales bacterium]|nr:hypothetical protein [Chthoniobacterales bacterium]
MRELDRETAKVMEACDTYGAVRIKRRDGRLDTLEAEHKKDSVINPPDIMARLKRQFPNMKISRKQSDFADKLLRGE